ncbi:hypothetical protein ACS0TY_028394 [Phlomoides rotata]
MIKLHFFSESPSQRSKRVSKGKKERKNMDQNKSAFLIGIAGAVITLSAYSQDFVSPTQCITVGLFVLVFGLLVREGLISL